MTNYLPTTYQPTYTYTPAVPQTYQQTQPAQPHHSEMGIKWVDGEVGAKAYQMPSGWPANIPIALWDTNDTVIYLKSMNPMGMPNPLQKIHYKIEEQIPKYMGQEQAKLPSGDTAQAPQHDMSQYVRKDELESMKDELKEAIESIRSATEQKAVRSNGKSAV